MTYQEIAVAIFCLLGLFLSGMLMGYAKGCWDKHNEYEKILKDQDDHYKTQLSKLRKQIDDADWWKFK